MNERTGMSLAIVGSECQWRIHQDLILGCKFNLPGWELVAFVFVSL